MKLVRRIGFCLVILLSTCMLSGCWNYREIDELAIVAGVAIDKGKDSKYKLTIEVVQIEGGNEAKTTSKLVEVEGNTMFDTVRNGLSLSGKKLYWSHTKVVIISEALAREGVVQVLDWFNRDAETRADFQILIAKGQSAREIFTGHPTTEAIQSYELNDMVRNQENLSKSPQTEIWQFINDLQNKSLSATAPTVTIKTDKTKRAYIMGSALFKGDKIIGFLDGEETKDMLFVKDEIEGGLLAYDKAGKRGKTPVSLEIFENKTKVEPLWSKQQVSMKIKTETVVAIDEIGGTENLIDEPMRTQLEQDISKRLAKRITQTIKKVQTQYGVDPFGFGIKLEQDYPQLAKQLGNWEDTFPKIDVNVTSKVDIRNSATLSETLKIGD